MTTQAVFQFLSAVLGGGLLAAAGNWVYNARSSRRQREIDYLSKQLADLYGPLHFLTSANEQLFSLVNGINDAYSVYFNRKWSADTRTQETLTTETDATIDLSNAYVQRAVQNNERAMVILERSWHLVDPEDVPLLSQFQVDYTRFLAEVKEGRRSKIPFSIHQSLGDISYMRPAMIAAIKAGVDRKQARLMKLTPGGTAGHKLLSRPTK